MKRSTREALLDAAEQLFGDRGIDAVTVRDITETAGANVAAVSYHFGSKENLLIAVLERRIGEMSERRASRLAQLESRRQRPTVREVVEAFFEPIVALLTEDPIAGQRYLTLLARLCQSGVDPTQLAGGADTSARYLALYQRAAPRLPDEVASHRIAIASSVILEVLGRPLSDGRPTPLLRCLETQALANDVLDFVVGGLSSRPVGMRIAGRSGFSAADLPQGRT